MVFEAQLVVTPVGKPVAVPIPVAPVVVCEIGVKAVLMHTVGVDEALLAVFVAVTVTIFVCGLLDPLLLSAVTVMVPPVVPDVTVIVVVPMPVFTVHPEGTCHV